MGKVARRARRRRRNLARSRAANFDALEQEWNEKLSAEGLGERIYKKQIRGPRGTPERAKAQQREIIVDPDFSRVWSLDAIPDVSRAPESALEALMRAAPHADPERDKETRQALREALLDEMEKLIGKRRTTLLTRRYFANTPVSQLAREAGVSESTMQERIKKARDILEIKLPGNPTIAAYLRGEL